MSLQGELKEARHPSPPAPPPRRRRWDLGVFLAVLLGPALLLAAAAAWRQRTGDLEERLLREAAMLDAPRPRPVHVERTLPGTFGEALGRHLPAFEAAWSPSVVPAEDLEATRAVVAGDAPLDRLPASAARAPEQGGPALDGVLLATHAERADLGETPGVGPAAGTSWTGLQGAALLAGVRIRRALAAADARGAAATCLDAQALGRDAAIAGGLVGRMTQNAIAGRLAPPCAAAFAALPPGEARAWVSRLRALRDALPSAAAMIEEQLVADDLLMFGHLLDPGAAGGLGPRARAEVEQGPKDLGLFLRLVARDSWRSRRRLEDAIAGATAADAVERDEALAEAEATGKRAINPMVSLMPSYGRYARRADASLRKLDAVVLAAGCAAFRADHGAWPGGLDDLAEADLLRPAERMRLEGAEFDADSAGELTLTVPLPQADPKDDPEVLTLRVARR